MIRVPGGSRVAIPLALVGLCTTTLSIGLALVPAPDEPNKLLAVTKVAALMLLLVLAGGAVYAARKRGGG